MKKANHVKIAKFVVSKKELQNLKGGANTKPNDCGCDFTTNSGCINGTGRSTTGSTL